ncbi:MAG TPA: 23S rRNA (pseudouridine(1915)-N(3))-methyltransferase RlmH [Polyangiales bacterium]|nr:23S rRNA (pseudouridine(1915)-N(3))-methyltransferase RlmH [Polyangiales bacterium]
MLRVAIIAVGKIKQAGLRAELDDYLGRIKRYAAFEEIELKDGSDAELQQRFERAIPKRAQRIALEVEGRTLTSHGLADLVRRAELAATPLAFLIGGAYGLPKTVSSGAHIQLSLSAMTLPHRLARLVLAEQVYRAFTILRNEPYSH